MKVEYKGYDIEVNREDCLGGWKNLYYSIYRKSDGFECVCDFTEGEDTVDDYIKYMKERIDAELLEDDPWEESAN